jgi:hypothetical protein
MAERVGVAAAILRLFALVRVPFLTVASSAAWRRELFAAVRARLRPVAASPTAMSRGMSLAGGFRLRAPQEISSQAATMRDLHGRRVTSYHGNGGWASRNHSSSPRILPDCVSSSHSRTSVGGQPANVAVAVASRRRTRIRPMRRLQRDAPALLEDLSSRSIPL